MPIDKFQGKGKNKSKFVLARFDKQLNFINIGLTTNHFQSSQEQVGIMQLCKLYERIRHHIHFSQTLAATAGWLPPCTMRWLVSLPDSATASHMFVKESESLFSLSLLCDVCVCAR